LSWQPIISGIQEAIRLIITADPEVVEITLRSLLTSGYATFLAALFGLPLGVFIGMRSFRGKRVVKTLFNAAIGIPTVSLGLFLYVLWSRSGPLGYLGLLYTIPGMAIGEAILIFPIVVTFVTSAVEAKTGKVRDLVRTLGASELDASFAVIREAWNGISLAIISSFNRAFAELGIAMMIDANIVGVTRVLTTNIALQTVMAEIGLSFALSIILMIIVLSLNFIVGLLKSED
jgi:tungstate transport system permease protein